MMKAFKTKLLVDAKHSPTKHERLLEIAKTCDTVRNWYVRTALDMMKRDGITVFSSEEELEKYSPGELSKQLTTLMGTDESYFKFKKIPAYSRIETFQQIHKSYMGGKGKKYVFIKQCGYKAQEILKNVEKAKKEAAKEKRELTEEELEKARVFITGRKKKIAHKPDDMYGVPRFPRFVKSERHKSFVVCHGVKFDTQLKYVFIPGTQGSKKLGIPPIKGIKIHYHDHGEGYELIHRHNSRVTISFDGEHWWMSVTQESQNPKPCVNPSKGEVKGIDLGIKTTAYVSNGDKIASLADDEVYQKLEWKKKFLESKRSKHFLKSTLGKIEIPGGRKVKKHSAKYKKLTKSINHLANKILRYKDTKLKTEAARVVAPGDIGVVLEELDWDKIKRNKKWSSKCQKANVGEQRECIVKRAKSLGILNRIL